jgi:hypothetical protein
LRLCRVVSLWLSVASSRRCARLSAARQLKFLAGPDLRSFHLLAR